MDTTTATSDFTEITMIDYSRPLAQRRESRKVCGPYRWTPARPGVGRGFYQSSERLACDRHGSTFRLRLEYANDNFEHQTSMERIDGYYCDDYQDAMLTPIIARLAHGRGYLAGWTMGKGMIASIDAQIYTNASDAAYAAHEDARIAAEREWEYAQREREQLIDDEDGVTQYVEESA